MTSRSLSGGRLILAGLLLVSACAPAARVARPTDSGPAFPSIPGARARVDINVVYPVAASPKPAVDSTFIFGSVGNGAARLAINGTRVPVAPNGAFLAFLPMPADGVWRLEADAGRAGGSDTLSVAYRPPPAPPQPPAGDAPARPLPEARPAEPAYPLVGVVVEGRDTLATGSQIARGTPTPTADTRWFFPRGARLDVVGRQGNHYRVRLTGGTEAWVEASYLRLDTALTRTAGPLGEAALRPSPDYVDVRIPAGFAPFRITADDRTVGVTVYGRSAPIGTVGLAGGDVLLELGRWEAAGGDSARLELRLRQPVWGYKAFYEPDGHLVVRVRRPPALDPNRLFHGLRILIDPGHPPLGATGPTGLTEAEANLAVAQRLADLLRLRGAEVVMTRTTGAPLKSATSSAEELWARVELAVDVDADLLISVHNNAFPDGVNPFERYGTETYYYHPFSSDLAEALLREIVGVTRIPNLGAKARSLALVRPTWMPSTLTESLFMMFPDQEWALRTPGFQQRLAEAHLRGIEAFLRGRVAAVAGL